MKRARDLSSNVAYERALQHAVFAKLPDRQDRAVAVPGDLERQRAATVVQRILMTAQNLDADAPELTILLDLYVQEQDRRAVTVGDACVAARISSSSALRSVGRLIDKGLVVRRPDPNDARRRLLSLTDRARSLLTGFIDTCAVEPKTCR